MTALWDLEGRVMDLAARPAPGARIVIVAASVPMPEIALLADGDGRFSLRLPRGVFMLRAHSELGTGEVEVIAPPTGEVVICVGA